MKKWILSGVAVVSMGLGVSQAQDNTLSAAEKVEGFKLLFDGSTVQSFKDYWVDYVKGDETNTNLDAKWKVNTTDHTISLPAGSTADVRSVKKYKDCELRWTYRIDGNQGLFYRSLMKYDRAWQSGVEYAINDVTNLGKDNPGAAYDLYAPPTPVPYNTFSTGKWNEGRIVIKGDSVEHWSNGVKVVGYRYHSKEFWAVYNAPNCKWPGIGPYSLTNEVAGTQDVGTGYIKEGYLGIQGDHGGKWQIKNMKLTELPCFGPVKADGSVCPGTPIALARAKTMPVQYTVARRGLGMFSVTFPNDAVYGASVVGMDGKIVSTGTLSTNGHKAEFTRSLETGLYFLRLETVSGAVTQKLNLL